MSFKFDIFSSLFRYIWTKVDWFNVVTYLIVIFSAFLRYLINIPKQILEVESYKVMTGAESKHTRSGEMQKSRSFTILQLWPIAELGSSLWPSKDATLMPSEEAGWQPIRGQYPGHVITISQSETRARVTGWQLARPGALIMTQPARRDHKRDATHDHPNISTFAHFIEM